MSVVKRDGSSEDVSYHKLVSRLGVITKDLPGADIHGVAQSVAEFVHDGVRTDQLDNFISMSCASLIYSHPDYDALATRVAVGHLHKTTDPSFLSVMKALRKAGRVDPALVKVAERNRERIEGAIVMQRDFDFDYFGFRTLERSYLLSRAPDLPPCERPQHMFMRVALGIHGDDVDGAIRTYELMSTKHFVHATPTLFNSGTNFPQLSSCYLLEIEDDSIDGIFKTMADCAQISKFSGGIGINIHKVRSKGAEIASTGGTSTGIVPMLRVFNNIARYVNQGGRRAGSIAVYLEPWHADIEAFIELRRNGGHNEDRCRDLFTALWVPDEFMRRVEADQAWSLMCPHRCPGLSDAYGDEFDALYRRYESEGKFEKQIRAKDLWTAIVTSQIESGTPYLSSKCAANRKSNQKHLGTMKSSNLCNEIYQFSSPEETAVCNLASICLPTFVKRGAFDYAKLEEVAGVVVRNLDKVISVNLYPTKKTRVSNMRHRPMGIGVQGLADTFALMCMPYDSDEAYVLEREIFRSIYYAAVKESVALAVEHAAQPAANKMEAAAKEGRWPGAHASFAGSPMQQGIFQFDMWERSAMHDGPGDRHDWARLRADVMEHGVRNSLLVALMPTATTSQICGLSECVEPFGSMLYKRKTLAGEFVVLNKYLARELINRDLWTDTVREQILLNNGSVQGLDVVPLDLQERFKAVWDIRQKHVILHAANRGPYVCQSQSMNVFVSDPTLDKMTRMHLYSWKQGLKTLSYYVRVSQLAKAQQFTLTPDRAAAFKAAKQGKAGRQDDEDAPCLMCSA
jgi:ribonucleoside-diphosphate reductase alpha subunit